MNVNHDLASYLPKDRPPMYWSQTYGYPAVMLVNGWYGTLYQTFARLSPLEPVGRVWWHSNDFSTFGFRGSWRVGKVQGCNGIQPGEHRIPDEVDAAVRALSRDLGMELGPWEYRAVENGTYALARAELIQFERIVQTKAGEQYALW